MTKKELTILRASSYRPPPDGPRCENCEHFWEYGRSGSCQAIEVRGKLELFPCHPFGVCDLWKEKQK